jgi:hypothetical protein
MNKRILRRIGIVALVLVLLFNTMGAQASTGASQVEVSTYDELIKAIAGASNLDTILIKGVIEIPKTDSLGDRSKTVTLKSSGGYIKFVDNSEITSHMEVSNIIFDGAGLELLSPYINIQCDVNFTDCTFKNCGNYGAVNIRYADCTFSNCTFKDNKGNYGAHICIGYMGNVNITECLFTGGVASNEGGGIYLDNITSSAVIAGCKITENQGNYGGGIANHGSVTISNTLLYDNTASTGGADLFSVSSYTIDSIEDMKSIFHEAGIEPLSWESDYEDLNYGGTCLRLNYETYVSPTTDTTEPSSPDTPSEGEDQEPVDPSPTEPSTEETQPSSTDEPTEPQEPSGADTGDDNTTPTTPSTTEEDKGGNTDSGNNSVGDNSTTNNISSSDSSGSGNTTDSSTHSSSTTTDSSTHSSTANTTTDNSTHSQSTDNSYRDSSSSTVNNYYQQEDKESSTAPQNASQPVNVSVPVTLSIPEQKEADTGTIEATEAVTATATPQQNIKIDAEGVDLVYEYGDNGVTISIKATKEAESTTPEVTTVSAEDTATKEAEKPQNSPNWVEVVIMILLAVLVMAEAKDKLQSKG